MKYDNCNLWTGRHHKVMFAFFVQATLKGEKHMNKEAMKQQILEALSKKLGNSFHLSIQKVLKTNEKLDGLTIRHGSENILIMVCLLMMLWIEYCRFILIQRFILAILILPHF